MKVRDLLEKHIEPLKLEDTVGVALARMGKYGLETLPLVSEEDMFLGMVKKVYLEGLDAHMPLRKVVEKLAIDQRDAVKEKEHIYEAFNKAYSTDARIVAITDEDGKYVGVATEHKLMKSFMGCFSFTEPGSIVVLRIAKRDYSLQRVAGIVEQEGASVLSSILHNAERDDDILLTLKINKHDPTDIIESFRRHEYDVVMIFSPIEHRDTIKERLEHLMGYLDV